ncbi:MAG TPA: hypothetical protein QGF58_07280 [Myxococcota bacterium]|nr:hypothetical protein [Myxococcota bacterium]
MIPPELREALEPSEDELARLVEPLSPGLLAGLSSATEPSAAELARLRPREARRRSPVWLLAVAAVLLSFVLFPRPDAPRHLAPGVEVYGSAHAAIVDEDALVIELRDGLANFRADRRVVVRAGEVDVDFESARVSILLDGGHVRIEVFTGQAEVRTGDGTVLLAAGTSWRRPLPAEPQAEVEGVRAQRVEVEDVDAVASIQPWGPLPRRPPRVDPAPDVPAFVVLMNSRDAGQLMLADVETFLSEYPESPFAHEASVMRLERLAEEVDPEDALSQVEAWLEVHAHSPRFAEVHYLRATLLRDRLEDCGAAMTSYRIVIERGPRRLAEPARDYLEGCLD